MNTRNTLITVLLLSFHALATASLHCYHQGEEYNVGDQLSFESQDYTRVDDATGQSPKSEGYAADAYSIVVLCAPVLDIETAVLFSPPIKAIPAQKAEWVVLPFPNDYTGLGFSVEQ